MRMKWAIAAVAALALAAIVVSNQLGWIGDHASEHAVVVGEACPADAKPANLNFTLKDLDNKDVTLADHKGKVLLVDFWATWCAPCKVEIPWFMEFQKTYGPQGLQVFGVSVDDTLDQLKPYAGEMKMNYPVLQGLGHDDMLEAYGPVVGIPITVIVSRDGRICTKHAGLGSKEKFEEQIKALL